MKPEEKYSNINPYKYKLTHEEIKKDFISLFELKTILNKAAEKDIKHLKRLYYLIYFIKLKEISEAEMIIEKVHKNLSILNLNVYF